MLVWRWKKLLSTTSNQNIEYCYIIDIYNKFQTNNNVVETFYLFICGHNMPYCIRKIPITQYEWGVPQIKWEEQDWDMNYSGQHLYKTLEEAKEFIYELKRING